MIIFDEGVGDDGVVPDCGPGQLNSPVLVGYDMKWYCNGKKCGLGLNALNNVVHSESLKNCGPKQSNTGLLSIFKYDASVK